jgi:hypothetical protein
MHCAGGLAAIPHARVTATVWVRVRWYQRRSHGHAADDVPVVKYS